MASARRCSPAVCADLERRGIATGEISWVSNLRFYGKCGARVSRVFLGGRRKLTELRRAGRSATREPRLRPAGQRQELQQRAEVAGHLHLAAHEPDREVERRRRAAPARRRASR